MKREIFNNRLVVKMNLSRLGEIAWDRREDYWVMLEATEQ